jgi:hypothetical protein
VTSASWSTAGPNRNPRYHKADGWGECDRDSLCARGFDDREQRGRRVEAPQCDERELRDHRPEQVAQQPSDRSEEGSLGIAEVSVERKSRECRNRGPQYRRKP